MMMSEVPGDDGRAAGASQEPAADSQAQPAASAAAVRFAPDVAAPASVSPPRTASSSRSSAEMEALLAQYDRPPAALVALCEELLRTFPRDALSPQTHLERFALAQRLDASGATFRFLQQARAVPARAAGGRALRAH